MKLSTHLSLIAGLRFAIQQAFLPTLFAVLRSPALLFRPRTLSRLFFSHVWVVFGDGLDSAIREIKDELITPHAHGVVLDLGAGHGHTMKYLSKSRVTKYVALEPNIFMHSRIRAMAAHEGFSEDAGTLLILSCGAEDAVAILSALGGHHKVDTLVSILALCSVPHMEQTVSCLANEILKPGGQFLLYEHVANERSDALWWQRFWAPAWKACFDGCVLYRPTDRYIQSMEGVWESHPDNDGEGNRTGIWATEEREDDALMPHKIGRLIKLGA